MRKTLSSLGFTTPESPPHWKADLFHTLAYETEIIKGEEMEKARKKKGGKG